MIPVTAKATFSTALNLLLFALVGTTLLALTYDLTHDAIARSIENEKLKLIAQIAPAETYDNNIIKDTTQLADNKLLGNGETTIAYLGRLKDQPSIAVMQVVAPDGYSGKISLIISIHSDGPNAGKVSGVRVISHKETPGLGDYIEIAKNKWISVFNDTSLESLKESEWKVKKDGGKFDYMAGATVTPRSIVKAVHKALQYYALHRDELFAVSNQTPPGLPLSGEEQRRLKVLDETKK